MAQAPTIDGAHTVDLNVRPVLLDDGAGLQGSGEPEAGEGTGVGKPGHGGYPVALDGENEQSVWPRDGCVRQPEVTAERGLRVCSGSHCT